MLAEILLSVLIYFVFGIITAFAYKYIRTKFYGINDDDSDDLSVVAALWPLIIVISMFVIPFNIIEFLFRAVIEKISELIASKKQKV